jgi:CheY-like chemotaxis protein
MITKLGYRVQVAGNGRLALELLARQDVDLVFMDCQMPDMDGFEATLEIRKREGRSRHTPIVAVTAHALTGDREKCLAAGMDDYLSKPIKSREVSAVLDRWLPGMVRGGATSAPSQPGHIDLSRLAELREMETPGEPSLVAELIGLFRDDGRQTLASLRSALGSGDRSAALRAAHALRGGAANIGAALLTELSAALEAGMMNNSLEVAGELLSRMECELELAATLLAAEVSSAPPGPAVLTP